MNDLSDWLWVLVPGVLLYVSYRLARVPAAENATAKEATPAPDASAPAANAAAPAPKAPPVVAELPRLDYEEDKDIDPTRVGFADEKRRMSLQPPTKRIVYDDDAVEDEPTHAGALILLTSSAQTDKGQRRKRNEDSLLVMEEHGVFVVADGMGGHSGGEVASKLAVKAIELAFTSNTFDGEPHDGIARRASELARAIQMANDAIREVAERDPLLEGMGTTICAARFSPRKQRLYIAHVGDSRMYRLRDGTLSQMTSDHTMKDLGVTGEGAAHLSRAVGVWPTVPIDIIMAKPQPGDLYILCSDGLTKMLTDAQTQAILSSDGTPEMMVHELVDAANKRGGKDNITVILTRVEDAIARAVASSRPPKSTTSGAPPS